MIANYVIDGLLGSGAYSWVYRATHGSIASLRVAVKVLRWDQVRNDEVRLRFRREAEMAASLRSPHAVRTTDFGALEDGTPFIVMDYVEGLTLERWLERKGPAEERDAARIAMHCCLALREAHSLGIIHRDVKPANIYLVNDPSGGPFMAKLLDFGIAKGLSERLPTSITDFESSTLAINCTPRYAAPELLCGLPSTQSDVYALGLTIAEALDGEPVYRGKNAYDVAARQMEEAPVPLGPRTLAGALAPIVAKAVEKDPRDRYSDVDAMLLDLQNRFTQVGHRIATASSTGRVFGSRETTGDPPAAARVERLLAIASGGAVEPTGEVEWDPGAGRRRTVWRVAVATLVAVAALAALRARDEGEVDRSPQDAAASAAAIDEPVAASAYAPTGGVGPSVPGDVARSVGRARDGVQIARTRALGSVEPAAAARPPEDQPTAPERRAPGPPQRVRPTPDGGDAPSLRPPPSAPVEATESDPSADQDANPFRGITVIGR